MPAGLEPGFPGQLDVEVPQVQLRLRQIDIHLLDRARIEVRQFRQFQLVGTLAEQLLIVSVPVEGLVDRSLDALAGFLGLFVLAVADGLDFLEDRPLVFGAEHREALAVLFFEGGLELTAERLQIVTDRSRLFGQHAIAGFRHGLVGGADGRGDVDPGGLGLGDGAGIDRGLVQGQLSEHALDVEAVVDFEQPVGNHIPVPEELLVAGETKIQCPTDGGDHRKAGLAAPVGRRWHLVEPDRIFQLASGVVLAQILADLGVGSRVGDRFFPGNRLRTRTEYVRGEHVQLGRLVDTLDGILAK